MLRTKEILVVAASAILPIVLAILIILYSGRLAEGIIPQSQAVQVVQTRYSEDRYIRNVNPDYIETDFSFIEYDSETDEIGRTYVFFSWYDADPTTEKINFYRARIMFQESYGYDFVGDLEERFVWAVKFHSPPKSTLIYFVDAHTGEVVARTALGGGY